MECIPSENFDVEYLIFYVYLLQRFSQQRLLLWRRRLK